MCAFFGHQCCSSSNLVVFRFFVWPGVWGEVCNKVKESCRVRFKTGVKMRMILDEMEVGLSVKIYGCERGRVFALES